MIVDGEFGELAREALALCEAKPLVIAIDDPTFPEGIRVSNLTYEAFIADGDPEFAWARSDDRRGGKECRIRRGALLY